MVLGCTRRDIVDGLSTKALLPVNVYWTKANLKAQNTTVMVYDESGALYLEKSFSSSADHLSAYGEIALEPGDYTVIVFNEIRGQIENIQMKGHRRLSEFEAYVTPVNQVYKNSVISDDIIYCKEPGILAVWKGPVTVTKEMVFYSDSESGNLVESESLIDKFNVLTEIYPIRRTAKVNFTVNVKGLNNARMPAMAAIYNMSEGYSFEEDKNLYSPVAHQFLMSERTYNEDSFTDGKIVSSINSFGLMGEQTKVSDFKERILFDLNFILVDQDKTFISNRVDITDNLEIKSDIEISISTSIEIETPLPDVKPEDSDGSGMDSSVEDWIGEDIDIIL